MIKKVITGIALTGALTIAAGFSTDTVSAQQHQTHNVHSFMSIQQLSESDIQKFLDKCAVQLPQKEQAAPEETKNEEQPAEETTEQPAEEQAQEQPAPEQPTAEQPQAEETTTEAPEQESQETAEQPEQENQEATEQPEQESQQASDELSQFEQEVVDLTNQERENQGLAPLEVDTELSKVAKAKSEDMANNGYFSHNSPTYGSPFDMMKQFGIDYQTAGENIAKGQRSPEEVVNAWMNSEGHRANILNGDFTHIGVGYVENGNVWTQQFIGK
ncbi:CAP domain-containing protein [Gracilibacillus timonensis]|uniref:CAP domain-containing protein n=1 Tax=Gracilibacillus timonensis TaxID=1816696 RepID=UPI0008259CF8|nr:CAP domain-containing protein [Gracilibacillus timonensis]